jgi:hypothetical protein
MKGVVIRLCTFIAAVCMLASLSVSHPNDVRHHRAGNYRHSLRDATRVVVARRCDRESLPVTPTVHLCGDAEQGRT